MQYRNPHQQITTSTNKTPQPHNTISNKYQVQQQIGSGQFGVVETILRKSDNQLMIWKKVKYGPMNSQQKQQVIAQVNILQGLNHPHIIKYYDRIVDKNQKTVYIVMEYCPGGDLAKRLKELEKGKDYLDEEIIWKIFYQILSALHFCHNRERKILHRDIKPANIFVDSKGGNVKLGDFGLSKQLSEYSFYANTHLGTPYYMSPQQMSGSKYNQKSDIWALGCVIYQLAALKRPFSATSLKDLCQNIERGKIQRIPSIYSEDLFATIKFMLQVNPQKRPSTNDLLKLPMIKARQQNTQILQRYKQLNQKQTKLSNYEKELDRKIAELQNLNQQIHRSYNYNEYKDYSGDSISYNESDGFKNLYLKESISLKESEQLNRQTILRRGNKSSRAKSRSSVYLSNDYEEDNGSTINKSISIKKNNIKKQRVNQQRRVL